MGRDWKGFDFSKYRHTMSASQLLTFEACPRKWWLAKIKKMPEMAKDHFEFGTIFHECLERYLLADDTGRDDKGQAVNLFPKGWDKTISRRDAALIRVLVNHAIDSGMVARGPNRQVEKAFMFQVLPGIGLMGFIDVASINGGNIRVEDHKTTKNFKWAKTTKSLAKCGQMLTGAAVMLREYLREGGKAADVERIELRHNVVLKNADAPKTRPIDALVSLSDIKTFWETRLVPAARDMLALKDEGLEADQWQQIPGPTEKDACSAYGGCPYATICTKRETPARYKDRIDRMNQVTLEPKKDTVMDQVDNLFSDLENMGGTPAAPPVASTSPATPPQTQEVQPEPQVEPTAPVADSTAEAPAASNPDTPPWTNPKCFVCQGAGFNSKGEPCKSCDAKAEPAARSENFTATPGDGEVVWQSIDGKILFSQQVAGAVAESRPQIAKPVERTDDVSEADMAETFEEVAEKVADEADKAEEAKVELKGQQAAKPGRGRPKRGFTLALAKGVTVTGKAPIVVDGFGLFRQAAQALATARGAETFYHLPAFGRGQEMGRRDALGTIIGEIVGQLPAGCVVVGTGNDDPDVAAFYTALRTSLDCKVFIS